MRRNTERDGVTVFVVLLVVVAPLVGAGVAVGGAPSTAQQVASFEVVSLTAPTSAQTETTISADAVVRNTGNASGTTTFQYRIDGAVVASREVTLAPGESRTITLQGTVPDRSAGTYQQGVFVGSTSEGKTASLSITEPTAAVFSVSNLQAPAQATSGQQITVQATVRNSGGSGGTTTLQYRIGGQVVATKQVSLDPNTNAAVSFQATVPTLPAGTYQQGVFVGNTDNGQTSSLVVGAQSPTFAVLSLQQTTREATVGDTVSATATVKNTGSAASTTTFQYRIGDRVIATRQVSLNAGQSTTLTFQGTVPTMPAGNYKQGVFVGTSNNGLTADVTVRARAASFSVTGFQAPTRGTAGDTVSVQATVTNTGTASGTKQLQYRIDGTVVGSRELTLAPGASRTVTIEGEVPSRAAGTYKQGVFVGNTTVGRETNIVLDPGAVFGVSALRAPSKVAVGDQITVTAVVKNTGSRAGEMGIQYRIGRQTIATRRVTLEKDQSTTVSFTVTVPDRASGTYRQGVFVGPTDQGQTSSLTIQRGTPAFQVDTVQAPSRASAGDRVTVQATVRNGGGAGATRTLEYRVGDRVVATRSVQLNAGASTTVTFEATIPDVPVGTYRQGVFVGDSGVARTTSLEVVPRVAPRPAFAIGSLDAPDSGNAGDQVTATAAVRNTGGAAGTTTVQYRVGGQVVATREVTLEPGGERTVSLEGSVPDLAPGSYTQGVFVGTSNSGPAAVFRVTGQPQFTVSDLQGPTTAEPGGQVTAQATVTNTGSARGSTEVQYRIDGTAVATESVELGAGESTTVTFEATIPDVEGGTYQQGVFVGETDRGQTSSVVVETSSGGFGPGFTGIGALVALVIVTTLARLHRN